MRVFRSTSFALALLLIAILPTLVLAQTVTDESGVVVKIHRFQAPAVAQTAPPASAAGAKKGELSASAIQQIDALEQDKQTRTPAQVKISSHLIYTARMLQGQQAAPGIPVLHTNLELDEQNNMLVDMKAYVSDDLLQRLRSAGIRIISFNSLHRSIRALIPADKLEAVAAYPEVTFISPRREAMTVGSIAGSKMDALARWGGALSPGFAQRAARVREQVSAQLKSKGYGIACTGRGSVTSEGYLTHEVDAACVNFDVLGAGVKIGVLSDGVTSLALSQASGDLGTVTVLPGQTGGGDEGTAMLEIVHDLAPSASLYFATAFSGINSFADNILALRDAGCDIIVDDVIYFVESPFQDGQDPSVIAENDGGVVIQAVNDVVADGAMYFSSAGNEGNQDIDFADTYEGDFVNGGTNTHTGPKTGTVHKFGTNSWDVYTFNSGAPILLHWADPLGASDNDYDLFILTPDGTGIEDSSTEVQNGAQDPVEGAFPNNTNDRIVVFKDNSAANRFLHVTAFGGLMSITTPGAVVGHAGATGAFAVGATPAADPICGTPSICPTGPFPNPFNSTNFTEPYSSDGPRHIFFEADGTPITPGNFSSTGGTVLQKPDVTAADGVSVTGVGGFGSPFYGTSAAAPHAAAIAGLVKSSDLTLTNTEIGGFMTISATDIQAAGTDRDSGAGIVDAFKAVQASLTPGITSLSPNHGDVGTPVTITGRHFGAAQGESTVTFNGTAATPTVWSDTSITVPVPAGATTGNVVVTVVGLASNGVLFTLNPHITSLNPTSGTVGVPVTVTGTNFGATQGSNTVKFNGTAGVPTNWSDTSITVPVPLGVSTGNVVVSVNSIASNGVNFTFVPPAITSLSVTSAPVGTAVTITGTSFGPAPGASTVKFNGTTATVTTWTDTSLSTTVPAGATTGNVVVNVNSTDSNGSAFTVQDFTFEAALTDITVTAGQPGSEDFNITSATGFDAAINLTCTGAPDKSTCTLTPNSVPAGGTPAAVHLAITTTAATTSGFKSGLFGLWLPFGGLGLVLAGVGTRKRSRKALAALSLFLLLPLLVAIVSCGGNDHHTIPGTPPGTYTLTVTATATGGTSHTSQFHLKVN